jgi:hypothetical protein
MQDTEGTPQKKFRNTAQGQCRNKLPEEGRGEWGKRLSEGLQIALPDETSGPPYTLQVKILHSFRAAFYIYLILLVGEEKIQHGINLIYFIYSVLNSANGRINYLQAEKGLEVKG